MNNKETKFSKVPSFLVSDEKNYLIENLSMLLTSGMGMIQALTAVKTGVKSQWTKKLIDNLILDINNGASLYRAFDHLQVFSPQIIYLIKIGEKSGKLAENLKVIAIQQKKEREFKNKLRSAMLYPAFVFGLTIVVGIGITWLILPRLANVFDQLNMPLPLVTRWMITIGLFLQQYGMIFVPILIIVLLVTTYLFFGFRPTKFIGEKLLNILPAMKKLNTETEISRLGFVLGNLLSAGLPISESLLVLSDGSNSKVYKNFYIFLQKNISDGNSFAKSFALNPKTDKLIPNPVKQMIIAGEQSGNLDKTLIEIGKVYEAKIDVTAKDLAVMLEPILLVIVWLGVLLIALAVILPIYKLLGGINTNGTQ